MRTEAEKRAAFVRLQADVRSERLDDLCEKHGREVDQVRRLAVRLVLAEDVDGLPPKTYDRAITNAMAIYRSKRKAGEPDWPEGAKLRRKEHEANNEAFLAEMFGRASDESAHARQSEIKDLVGKLTGEVREALDDRNDCCDDGASLTTQEISDVVSEIRKFIREQLDGAEDLGGEAERISDEVFERVGRLVEDVYERRADEAA